MSTIYLIVQDVDWGEPAVMHAKVSKESAEATVDRLNADPAKSSWIFYRVEETQLDTEEGEHACHVFYRSRSSEPLHCADCGKPLDGERTATGWIDAEPIRVAAGYTVQTSQRPSGTPYDLAGPLG